MPAPRNRRHILVGTDGKLGEFLKRFEQYATELTKGGEPKQKELVDRIAALRLAMLRQLWTDDPAAYPHEQAIVWWEVWLRRSGGGELERFIDFCRQSGIQVGARQLAFDDRIVCLALASAEQLAPALVVIGDLAKLRRGKTSTRVLRRSLGSSTSAVGGRPSGTSDAAVA